MTKREEPWDTEPCPEHGWLGLALRLVKGHSSMELTLALCCGQRLQVDSARANSVTGAQGAVELLGVGSTLHCVCPGVQHPEPVSAHKSAAGHLGALGTLTRSPPVLGG